ncbi:MAG TPA: GGDEF domain-containing protein [Jatrophihabitans sp.]|nr:GGDEF domain-containing protein [Jatrophihabitans sp.]
MLASTEELQVSGSAHDRQWPLGRRLRAWEIWATPRAMCAYVLLVEAIVLPWALLLPLAGGVGTTDLARAGLIAGLAICFEELSIRTARLRNRLASYSYVDMNSVWTFGAAVVLPAALIAPLCVVVIGNTWLRHGRSGGYRIYRQFFAGTVALASCYLAHAVLLVEPGRLPITTRPASVLCLCAALAGYMVANAGLLHTAIYLAVRPADLRSLFGSWDDIALELATLCLGGMIALALLRSPLLAMLVIPPMYVLQRSVLTKQLEIAATTDAKTGLLNAATWHQVASVELARAERERYGAALLIIDMDNFKLINDAHGHLTGDDVLKAVADCLAEEMRGYDSVGRFGGEEFVVVLSEVDEFSALTISERLRVRIGSLQVPSRADDSILTGLSCSIGLACYPSHGTDAETLLHAADAAMYAAKRNGRNRVQLSSARLTV